MTTYKYLAENSHLYISAKETSFRTNSAGKDTALTAGTTVYSKPVIGGLTLAPTDSYKFTLPRGSGYSGPAYISPLKRISPRVDLSGYLQSFRPMYFLCGGCTTVDEGSYYSHTYSTTTSRTAPPPSTQILIRQENASSAQNFNNLWVGSIVESCRISWQAGDAPRAAWSFRLCKAISQSNLDSWPSYDTKAPYPSVDDGSSGTDFIKKGGTAYEVTLTAFEIIYKSGIEHIFGIGDAYPVAAAYISRNIILRTKMLVEEKAILTDMSSLSVSSANDIDVTLRLYRNTTNDYLKFSFEKLFPVEVSYAYYDNYLYELSVDWILNPVESGNKLTIEEANSVDETQYDG